MSEVSPKPLGKDVCFLGKCPATLCDTFISKSIPQNRHYLTENGDPLRTHLRDQFVTKTSWSPSEPPPALIWAAPLSQRTKYPVCGRSTLHAKKTTPTSLTPKPKKTTGKRNILRSVMPISVCHRSCANGVANADLQNVAVLCCGWWARASLARAGRSRIGSAGPKMQRKQIQKLKK